MTVFAVPCSPISMIACREEDMNFKIIKRTQSKSFFKNRDIKNELIKCKAKCEYSILEKI